jgi:hypothetical protein
MTNKSTIPSTKIGGSNYDPSTISTPASTTTRRLTAPDNLSGRSREIITSTSNSHTATENSFQMHGGKSALQSGNNFSWAGTPNTSDCTASFTASNTLSAWKQQSEKSFKPKERHVSFAANTNYRNNATSSTSSSKFNSSTRDAHPTKTINFPSSSTAPLFSYSRQTDTGLKDKDSHRNYEDWHAETAPLKSHQIYGAGYLTAKAAQAEPIDKANERRIIIDGTESTHRTRGLHDCGRRNVGTDLLMSGGESARLLDAVREVANSEVNKGFNYDDSVAATSVVLKVANCGESARVLSRTHAPKLKGKETVSTISSNAYDHTWAVVKTPDGKSFYFDAWSNSPGMLSEDTTWQTPGTLKTFWRDRSQDAQQTPPTVGSTHIIETFYADAKGAAAEDTMLRDAEYFSSGSGQSQLRKAYESSNIKMPSSADFLVSETMGRSLHADYRGFADQAREALGRQSELHQEVLALGSLCQGYKRTISTGIKQTQSVLHAARTLDTRSDKFTRPPIRKSHQ